MFKYMHNFPKKKSNVSFLLLNHVSDPSYAFSQLVQILLVIFEDKFIICIMKRTENVLIFQHEPSRFLRFKIEMNLI